MLSLYDLKMETIRISPENGQQAGVKYAVKVTHLPTKLSVQLPVDISTTLTMKEVMIQLERLVKNEKEKSK